MKSSPRGWAPHPINFVLIALYVVIYVYLRYIRAHGPRHPHFETQLSANTDRWTAAVVAIDQLPRKIAGVTDTKREKNAMSEDKNNEEERTATQTVANAAVDDAIGGNGMISETVTR